MLHCIINLDTTPYPFPPSKSPFGHTSSDPAFPHTNFWQVSIWLVVKQQSILISVAIIRNQLEGPQTLKNNAQQLKIMISYICTPLYYIPLPSHYMTNSPKYRSPSSPPLTPLKKTPRLKFFLCHCQMGRQDNDPTMVNSSIALLQERFRQLEKMKERREGKELLKLLSSETQRGSSSMHNPTSQSSPQPRSVVPHMPSVHDSLSLGLNLNTKQGDHNSTMKSPLSSSSSSLWPQGASSSSRNFDSSDVDTSLHL